MNAAARQTDGKNPVVAPAVAIDGPAVAIDGPAASGKSSVGRAAAAALGLRFLDTGIMYRALTWLALHRNAPVADAATIGALAENCIMAVAGGDAGAAVIVIDGHPLGDALVSAAVDRNVSAVSAAPAVRTALVAQQRAIAAAGGIVMAGRDIGSVVLPGADVKLYIDASPEERARRRFAQLRETGAAVSYQQVLADTIRRDCLDTQRADSPLVAADGAVVINTDGIDLAQTVAAVVSAICAATGLDYPAGM